MFPKKIAHFLFKIVYGFWECDIMRVIQKKGIRPGYGMAE